MEHFWTIMRGFNLYVNIHGWYIWLLIFQLYKLQKSKSSAFVIDDNVGIASLLGI